MTRHLTPLVACFIAVASLSPAQAQQKPSPDAVQATALLMRSTEYLAKAQSFSATIESAYDVVQKSGQKIEFREVRHVLLNRPDGLRIDMELANGSKHQAFFDGKSVTLFEPKQNVFASMMKTGTVDQILSYIVNDLKTRVPLSMLLVTTLPQELESRITDIALVGDETLTGKAVAHLAVRSRDVDMQVWIARDGEPVPLRVVLTYKRSAGAPQFSAMLSDWNFSPKIDPSAFVFVPPAGAEAVAFMVPVPGKARIGKTRR